MSTSVSSATLRRTQSINTNKTRNEEKENKHDNVFQAATYFTPRVRTNALSLITKGIFIMGAVMCGTEAITVEKGRYAFGPEGCNLGSKGKCFDFNWKGPVLDAPSNEIYNMSSMIIIRGVGLSYEEACFSSEEKIEHVVQKTFNPITQLVSNQECEIGEDFEVTGGGKISVVSDGAPAPLCQGIHDKIVADYVDCRNKQPMDPGIIAAIVVSTLAGVGGIVYYFRKQISNCISYCTNPSENIPSVQDNSQGYTSV